jgi:hypothetical protein
MSISEQEFEKELESFRINIETASQYFYAYQTIHFVLSEDKSVQNLLNWYPMFWNTNIGALREAMFIALGRIFDQDSKTHNIDGLLRISQDNPDIFKISAPRWCQQEGKNIQNAQIYEPLPDDWRRLRKHVNKYRKVYQDNYRNIRNKVYAHQERLNPKETTELFQKTRYIELEKLFAFLTALYVAIQNLYYAGQKPIIRYRRYSLLQMLKSKNADRKDMTTGESVAWEARSFLKSCIAIKQTDGTLSTE